MQALKIGHVTGDMERKYLPRAVFHDFVAMEPSVEHEAALRRPVALANPTS
jgi:hypothetical protein